MLRRGARFETAAVGGILGGLAGVVGSVCDAETVGICSVALGVGGVFIGGIGGALGGEQTKNVVFGAHLLGTWIVSAAASVAFAWPAWTRGALVLAFGLVILASGIHIYMSGQLPRGYANFFRALPFYYRGNLYGFVPYGLGVSLIGIADIVRRQPYSDALLYIGLISIGIGLLVVFWHPNWMRPKYMRDRRYD